MILKIVAFIAVLAALAGLVWLVPVLWELAIAGLIGATYWIFFRIPPGRD